MTHKLITQLTNADGVTDAEIEELFSDLTFIYNNPFDAEIEKAIAVRGCAYVEVHQPRPN